MLGIVQLKQQTDTDTTADQVQVVTEEAFEQVETPEEDTYYFIITSL